MVALNKTTALALRITQAVLAVIVLGCAAAGLKYSTAVICIFTCVGGTYTSPVMSFLVAASVLSLVLCGLYITMMFVPRLCTAYGEGVNPTRNFTIAMLTIDSVWMIFWFAAAVSSAVDASTISFSTWAAAAAFSWFSWVAWVVSVTFDTMHLVALLRGSNAGPATSKTADAAAPAGTYAPDVEAGKPAAPVAPMAAVPPAAHAPPAAAYPQV